MDELTRNLADLRQAVAAIDPADPLAVVAAARCAQDSLDRVLNEAMAQSALRGASLRQVAAESGLAPNTVAARLSQAPSMAAYAPAGRVTSDDLAVERRARAVPLTFTRRRKDPS